MSSSNDISVTSRRLDMIYFYMTEDCNLRCRHCWLAPRYHSTKTSSSYLPYELYCSIIKEAKPLGMTAVKLTGGEPLFHPRIGDILDYTRDEGLVLTIETNGVFCSQEIAKKIALNKSPFISVSLDSADEKTHEWVRGVEGCYNDAVAGIRNLVEAGLKPQIIMTVMRHNKDQMESMVKFAESLGVGSLKFNVVQPTARGENLKKTGETLSIDELVKLGDWVENTLSKTTNVKLFYCHPPAFRPLGSMFGEKGSGCGICGIKNILGVLSDGSYALCGIGKSIPELVFGNATKDKLADVWNNNPILNELNQHLPQRLTGVCSLCMMKHICLGSCIAQNYYRSRDLWAPYWYCEEAYNKGLFPPSRLISYNKLSSK